jgi:hypothetical protein
MTSKLSLYNGALQLLKERPLAALTENGPSRRSLDSAWDRGAVRACLEDGFWKHATRAVMLDASPSVTPAFGYTYAFEKPDDFVRLVGVWSDEALTQPFDGYREEAGYWFASLETIYIKYVSDDTAYGMDMSLWPQSFVELVEAELAAKAAGPLTEIGQDMLKLREMRLTKAQSRDSQVDPTKHPPTGSWVRARSAGRYRNDGQPR